MKNEKRSNEKGMNKKKSPKNTERGQANTQIDLKSSGDVSLSTGIILLVYILFPFVLEISVRGFQNVLTTNYFILSFVIAIVNIIPFLSFPKYSKLWVILYFILFFVPTLVDVCHIYFFVGSIDLLAMKAVFETNISEAQEFIVNLANATTVSLVLVLIASSLILFYRALNINVKKRGIKSLFLIFLVGIVASCFVHDKYKPTFARMIRSYIYYVDQKNFVINSINQRKNLNYGSIYSMLPDSEKQTYVIVIGESANKEHHSLYGYERKTNPELEKIKQELFVFDNVTSAHCQTLEVLQEALSFDEFVNGDVISFFQKAGFKTFWLSNQFNGGRWDNIIALVGNQADVSNFINQRDSQKMYGVCYDELLFPLFKTALEDPAPKKIIFLHLLGSHSIYANRYPKNYEKFKGETKIKQIISEYDNSIVYTDWVLSEFIELLKKQNENSYLLYLSDHGEDVRDDPDCCFYHSPSIATPPMFSIPFFVWISEKYAKTNAEFIKTWNVHKKYKTNKLIHSILRLSRLKNDKIKSEYSIFN